MENDRDNLMHGARTAMNRDQDIRAWCENWLKERERANHSDKNDEEFEQFWKYHKPEIMHAGAGEAILAYKERNG
ncbi:MAG: hypothetical protein R2684_14020 [Pyrinomonadaceae bacterium]